MLSNQFLSFFNVLVSIPHEYPNAVKLLLVTFTFDSWGAPLSYEHDSMDLWEYTVKNATNRDVNEKSFFLRCTGYPGLLLELRFYIDITKIITDEMKFNRCRLKEI